MRTLDTVATIDIGTNSVLLLVARIDDRELVPVEERATITRLGEGVDKTRALSAEAVERTLACLEAYARAIEEHGAGRVDVVGTSAMRDARGSESFRTRARELLGVEPRVISGDEEARLTFRGGQSGITVPEGPVVVFDIGGGSTELIRGERLEQRSAISLDVGSVRLTERHVRSDPPTSEEIARVVKDIDEALDRAGATALEQAALVGVAGTVTTLAAIALNVEPYDAARIHGAKLTAAQIDGVVDKLVSVPLAARVGLPGLSPKRADVIVAGAKICQRIVQRAGAKEIIVSDRGVRWGLAEELARR